MSDKELSLRCLNVVAWFRSRRKHCGEDLTEAIVRWTQLAAFSEAGWLNDAGRRAVMVWYEAIEAEEEAAD